MNDNQLNNNIMNSLKIFNDNVKYKPIRKLYREHFDCIFILVDNNNPKIVIEDISLKVDSDDVQKIILEEHLLLTEINRGIKAKIITKKDIEE